MQEKKETSGKNPSKWKDHNSKEVAEVGPVAPVRGQCEGTEQCKN